MDNKTKKLDQIAHELAKNCSNETLENPESIGFIRFMMFSCLFFHATGQCGGVPCENCKATRIILNGITKHPELKEEYDKLQNIEGRKA